MPPPAWPEDDTLRFDDAIRHFRARVPMSDKAFAKLDAEAKRKAFAVAGAADLDLVTDVWSAIDQAISEGTTFDDFRRSVGGALEDAWGGKEPWHLDTIFRTNIQLSYSAGRWKQQRDPAVMKVRPVWEFSAVLDARTSEICGDLNGTKLPADDPFWDEHNPPCHFNCRSTIIALTEEQGGELDDEGPDVDTQEGFGLAPGADEWSPDLTEYPADLRAIYEDK